MKNEYAERDVSAKRLRETLVLPLLTLEPNLSVSLTLGSMLRPSATIRRGLGSAQTYWTRHLLRRETVYSTCYMLKDNNTNNITLCTQVLASNTF